MVHTTPTQLAYRRRGLRAWLTDGSALMDLWIATCGLGGPGLALFFFGAEVVRLGVLGRIDAASVPSFDRDPIAQAIGLASMPPPVALGLCILSVGLVVLMGAWRLVRARAEVIRGRGG